MNYRRQIKRTIFLALLLFIQQTAFAQIEYRLTASIFGNYLSGDNLKFEHWGVNYTLPNQNYGYGVALAYNIKKYISINLRINNITNTDLINDANQEISYSNMMLSFGAKFQIIPLKKISPYIFANINRNSINVYYLEYLVNTTGQVTTVGNSYSTSHADLGYSFGVGAILNFNVKWAFYVQLGKHSDPVFNSISSEVGLQFNFLRKKH